MRSHLTLSLCFCLATGAAWAADLPIATAARLVNIISRGAGENGKVACQNPELSSELTKAGGEISPYARLAWANTVEEVRSLSLRKKCVIANDPKFLAMGAAVALYEEGGKVKMVLNPKAISASGITLSDQVLKVAAGQ